MTRFFSCQNYTIFGIFSKKKRKKVCAMYAIDLVLLFLLNYVNNVNGFKDIVFINETSSSSHGYSRMHEHFPLTSKY